MTSDPVLKRIHARRLRDIYRSVGWPCLDVAEIELLAAGLLERQCLDGHDHVRVTDAGIQYLASAAQRNRQLMSAHDALVDQVARVMLRDGRLVWKNLSLRAWLAPMQEIPGRRKMSMSDVFSIRNSSMQAYLEPIVHEIKVSRADLLGDLKRPDKREAYMDLGGQCWAVMPRDGQLDVVRAAPQRTCRELPFGVWMALSKATPIRHLSLLGDGTLDQAGLMDEGEKNS